MGWVSVVSRSACIVSLGLLAGCSVFYPELTTPVTDYPKGLAPTSEPPEGMLYLKFKGASIPKRTRDGRSWDAVGGEAPDPYASLTVDGREIIRTAIEPNTFEPRWPEGPGGNYRIKSFREAKVEVWDENTITDHPICVHRTNDLKDEVVDGQIVIKCDSGARVVLEVGKPRPQRGLGLSYELRTTTAYVTRVLPESPASRAGLAPGQQIVSVQGRNVERLERLEVESLINAYSPTGLKLEVVGPGQAPKKVRLKEGPVFLETRAHADLSVEG